jgi:hypothetical protein
MPGLEQGARHDPDGVGEVDDPRVGLRVRADGVRHAQDDRHRAEGLGESAGTRGLLPDAVHIVRPGLVAAACVLAADPQLDEHRVGARDSRDEVGGPGDAAWMRGAGEHPLRHAGHQVEAFGARVDEPEFLDRQAVAQPGEAVDELGGVGGATPDDGEFH